MQLEHIMGHVEPMTSVIKTEPTPRPQVQTALQQLKDLLREQPLPISTLSREMGRPEKEVLAYLEALQRTRKLEIKPAECGKCGFKFLERSKVRKPSKCPKCKGTYIVPPEYALKD